MSRRTIRRFPAVLLALLLLLGGSAVPAESSSSAGSVPAPISRQGFLLDTYIQITLYGCDDRALLDRCFAQIERYEALFSRTLPESELALLNRSGEAVVSPETADLIARGLAWGKRTDGVLDISIGPASSLWRFDPESPRIPPPSSLISAVSHIDYRQIAVEGTTVRLPQGAMLDLGAIAKGYIADRLKEFLLAEGVESALINLGGNLLCVGQKPGGVPFRVGVQLPFSAYGQTAVTLLVSDRSAVTSGIYERCFEQ
ncbi:MAG: FAD:protein FMN transferase, partial [Oscillospiraceae bacterium]